LLDQAKSFVERKQKREAFLKSLDSEHKRIVDEILENHRRHRKNILAKSEDVMSDTEKRIRELIDQFKIRINRSEMGKEAIKGYNKCKDNDQAFIEHKKGALFPRKYIDPHSILMERKEHIEDLEREIKKIEEQESYRNDIYTYAYKVHISPRMVSGSPNQSQQSQMSKLIL
jgi:polyhydroxyalkanoate synthesis regulator phasin